MMKQNDIKKMELLLDRYLDGNTTYDEERLLHSLFRKAGNDIPEEWHVYSALFAFEDEETGETMDKGTSDESGAKIIQMKSNRKRKGWIRVAVACAAAVLIIGIVPFVTDHHSATTSNANIGNYAVIDGHRTTDSATVKQQAMEALNAVSAHHDEDFAAMTE